MRAIGIIAVGLLALGAVAQTAYIFTLRRDVTILSQRLDGVQGGGGVSDDAAGGRTPGAAPTSFMGRGGLVGAGHPAPGRLAPASPSGFSNSAPAASSDESGGALPLPDALSSPEAREQLRRFMAAELKRLDDMSDEERRSARDERQERNRERVAKELGLNDEESRKLGELMINMQNTRRELMAAVRSGQKTRAEVQPQMAALRDKTQTDLKELLGEERFPKFQQLQRQDGITGASRPAGAPQN